MKTLRDEFALLRASQTVPIDASSIDGRHIMYDQWAEECYEAADAFMRARQIPADAKSESGAPWPQFQVARGEPEPVEPTEPPPLPSIFVTWPAHSIEPLTFTDSDMLHIEEIAEVCATWMKKWKGVTPCRNCESMALTPFGYKCEKCGGEDIPF